jgi:hypothetical protein
MPAKRPVLPARQGRCFKPHGISTGHHPERAERSDALHMAAKPPNNAAKRPPARDLRPGGRLAQLTERLRRPAKRKSSRLLRCWNTTASRTTGQSRARDGRALQPLHCGWAGRAARAILLEGCCFCAMLLNPPAPSPATGGEPAGGHMNMWPWRRQSGKGRRLALLCL